MRRQRREVVVVGAVLCCVHLSHARVRMMIMVVVSSVWIECSQGTTLFCLCFLTVCAGGFSLGVPPLGKRGTPERRRRGRRRQGGSEWRPRHGSIRTIGATFASRSTIRPLRRRSCWPPSKRNHPFAVVLSVWTVVTLALDISRGTLNSRVRSGQQ